MVVDAPATCAALLVRLSGGTGPLVQRTLEEDGLWVTTCYDRGEALQRLQTIRPDLLLVEIQGSGTEEWQVCQELAAAASQPMLALVQDPAPETRLAAFASGADDVLALPFEPLELVARVRALLRRGSGRADQGGAVLRHRDLELDVEGRLAHLDGRPLALTPLEFRLLRTLLEHPRQSFSREDLLARVHTFDDRLPSDRSIDLHVTELRAKLGDPAEAPRYIETVRGVGYRLAARAGIGTLSTALSAALPLEGRTALVAGGAYDAGGAVAEALAAAGASVVLLGPGPESEPLAADLRRRGRRAAAVSCDPAVPVKVRQSVEAVLAEHGSVDIVVWSGGAVGDWPLHELDDEAWRRLLDASLGGALAVVRGVVPGMLERRWGRVLILVPRADGRVPMATVAEGLVGFTRAFAADVAGTGVTANAIRHVHGHSSSAHHEGLARAALLLAGDDAAGISGQVIEVEA